MMPGIGFEEMILLVLVAIVVIGPKDLPLMMRKFGRFTGKMRAMAFEFKQGFDELGRQAELDELRKEVADLKNITGLEDLKREFEEDKRNLEKDVTSALEASAPVVETPALPAPEATPLIAAPQAPAGEGEQPATVPAVQASAQASADLATPTEVAPAQPAAAQPAAALPLKREVWPRPHKRKPPGAAPEPAPYAGLSADHPGYDSGEDFRIEPPTPEAAKPANGSASGPVTRADSAHPAPTRVPSEEASPPDDNVHVIPDDHVRPAHPAAALAPARPNTTKQDTPA